MRKYINILIVVIFTALSSCKHLPTEADFIEGLNKYPTTFPNMESDVFYFQENTLIQFDHTKQLETKVLTTKVKPYTIECSGNRKLIFYVDNAWMSGTLMRFDISSKIEVEFRQKVSGFYPSYDGNKILYGEMVIYRYFNYLTGVDKDILNLHTLAQQTLADSTLKVYIPFSSWGGENVIRTELWIYKMKNDTVEYKLPDKEMFSIVENDTFRVLSIKDIIPTSSEWVYNNDSSYAYTIKNISGFPRGYILNVKTGVQKQILAEEGDHLIWSIDFSPSGKQIVYSLYFSKAANLMDYVFIANSDGSSPTLISNKKVSSMRAVFVSK